MNKKIVCLMAVVVLVVLASEKAHAETFSFVMSASGDTNIVVELENLAGHISWVEDGTLSTTLEVDETLSGDVAAIEKDANPGTDETGAGTIIFRVRTLNDGGAGSPGARPNAVLPAICAVLLAGWLLQRGGQGKVAAIALIFAVSVLSLGVLAQSSDRADYIIRIPTGAQFNQVTLSTLDSNIDVTALRARTITLNVEGDGDIQGTNVHLRNGISLTAGIEGEGDIHLSYVEADVASASSDFDLSSNSGDVYVHFVHTSFDGSFRVQSLDGTAGWFHQESSWVTSTPISGGLEGTVTPPSSEGEHDVVAFTRNGQAYIVWADTPLDPPTTTPGPIDPPPDPGDNEFAETDFRYTLTQNNNLYTVPLSHKVESDEDPPANTDSGLYMSAGKNEYEVVQVVWERTSKGSASVSFTGFSGLSGEGIAIAYATFESGIADDLVWLTGTSGSVPLSNSHPTPILFQVYVPKNAQANVYTGTVTIDGDDIPITLRVFDFVLPDAPSFRTQHNLAAADEDFKNLLFTNRMSSKNNNWPSGFGWGITWDSSSNPNRCTAFYDEPDEGDDFAIGALSQKFMRGIGWDGPGANVGFPMSMLFQFVDNSNPRPSSFCGESISGDHLGPSSYNTEWSNYISALGTYLTQNNLIDKGYYYVMNEPQNEADYEIAAFLCNLNKDAAPNLKIAISEEPKPEIAEHASYPDCGYDIWIAHLPAWKETYAHSRQVEFGEEVWWYSLPQDADPFPNPTVVTNQGMHTRILPWISWTARVTGFAYFDSCTFFNNNNCKMNAIRSLLMRESYEDYEYLLLTNNGQYPAPLVSLAIDAAVAAAAGSRESWTKNDEALMVLRHEIGRYISGLRTSVPSFVVNCNSPRPRAEYAISFQGSQPSDNPLIIDNREYMKIGWDAYDSVVGYGWSGENIGTSIVLSGFDSETGSSKGISFWNLAQRSYLYDNFGRANSFEFDIPNGSYRVHYSVGRPRRGYPNDPHNLKIEGQHVVEDHITTDEDPVVTGSVDVSVQDCQLTLVVGGKSPLNDAFAFTFISTIRIVPI